MDGLPNPGPDNRMPRLVLDGFSGPLDQLLDLARAHQIDLARVSIPALADQLATALQCQTPLGNKGDWVVMAAWLLLLRSQLLLPADEPAQQAALTEADRLRGRMLALVEMQKLMAWLGRRTQLGHDVFARGRPEPLARTLGREPDVDVVEFLWASLNLFDDDLARPQTYATYRPVWDDLFPVAEARARIMQRLASSGGQSMERLLPDRPAASRLQKRSRWTSTFVASLELAKQGALLMEQDGVFSPIQIRPAEAVALAD